MYMASLDKVCHAFLCTNPVNTVQNVLLPNPMAADVLHKCGTMRIVCTRDIVLALYNHTLVYDQKKKKNKKENILRTE